MKTYLGDGVYAELLPSGYVCLTTSDGSRTTNTIYLESEVLEAFSGFLNTIGFKMTQHTDDL